MADLRGRQRRPPPAKISPIFMHANFYGREANPIFSQIFPPKGGRAYVALHLDPPMQRQTDLESTNSKNKCFNKNAFQHCVAPVLSSSNTVQNGKYDVFIYMGRSQKGGDNFFAATRFLQKS